MTQFLMGHWEASFWRRLCPLRKSFQFLNGEESVSVSSFNESITRIAPRMDEKILWFDLIGEKVALESTRWTSQLSWLFLHWSFNVTFVLFFSNQKKVIIPSSLLFGGLNKYDRLLLCGLSHFTTLLGLEASYFYFHWKCMCHGTIYICSEKYSRVETIRLPNQE